MGITVKQTYDPHLLFHAINITVELQYKVPMQKVYDILEAVDKSNEKQVEKIQPEDVLSLLKTLGDKLETKMSDDSQSSDNNNNLQSKIKELLRLLGCELSDAELNQILKGELSINDALSKQARIAWLILFEIDEDGHSKPNKTMVENLLLCTELLALETIELKLQHLAMNRSLQEKQREASVVLAKADNLKTMYRAEKEKYDPIALEKKRNKLRLYIAHMHGYDKDRDRDGSYGIDLTTGIIIDFGDIYIADKVHGSIIEDIQRDGIDMSDIR